MQERRVMSFNAMSSDDPNCSTKKQAGLFRRGLTYLHEFAGGEKWKRDVMKELFLNRSVKVTFFRVGQAEKNQHLLFLKKVRSDEKKIEFKKIF